MTVYHTIITLLGVPCLSLLNLSLTKRLQKEQKLNKLLRNPFNSQETEVIMQATITHAIPTSTEIGLSDSKAAEYEEQERDSQAFTTEWTNTSNLREPLLQEQ